MQVEHPVTKQVHKYWFESPRVAKPYHENAVGDEGRLFPRDCREGVSFRDCAARIVTGLHAQQHGSSATSSWFTSNNALPVHFYQLCSLGDSTFCILVVASQFTQYTAPAVSLQL